MAAAENTKTPHSEHLPGCWRQEPFQLLNQARRVPPGEGEWREPKGPIRRAAPLLAAQGSGEARRALQPKIPALSGGRKRSRKLQAASPSQTKPGVPLPVTQAAGGGRGQLCPRALLQAAGKNRQQLPPEGFPSGEPPRAANLFPVLPKSGIGAAAKAARRKERLCSPCRAQLPTRGCWTRSRSPGSPFWTMSPRKGEAKTLSAYLSPPPTHSREIQEEFGDRARLVAAVSS